MKGLYQFLQWGLFFHLEIFRGYSGAAVISFTYNCLPIWQQMWRLQAENVPLFLWLWSIQSHKVRSPERKTLHGCLLVLSFSPKLSHKWISWAQTATANCRFSGAELSCCAASCIDLNNRLALYAGCVYSYFIIFFTLSGFLKHHNTQADAKPGQSHWLCAVDGTVCHSKAAVTLLKQLSNYEAFYHLKTLLKLI